MDKNSFLISLSESDHADLGRVDFHEQSEPQKVFTSVWELESQVNNGGFDQFFVNSDPQVIEFSTHALRTIGAFQCAEIVEQALAYIHPMLADPAKREEILDRLTDEDSEALDGLDSSFYEYPDDLTTKLFSFVSQHPEEFGPVPTE